MARMVGGGNKAEVRRVPGVGVGPLTPEPTGGIAGMDRSMDHLTQGPGCNSPKRVAIVGVNWVMSTSNAVRLKW